MKRQAVRAFQRGWLAFGLVSMSLAFVVYWWLLEFAGSPHGQLVAGHAISGTVLHELLGHWLAMRVLGHRSSILLLPVTAFVFPEDRERFQQVSRYEDTVITLAGPSVNMALTGIGLALMLVTPWTTFGWVMASINAGLAAFNLLPLLFLDGNRILSHLLESLPQEWDVALQVTLSLLTLLSLGWLWLTGHWHPYPILIVWGLHWTRRKSSPDGHLDESAIDTRRVQVLAVLYGAFLLGSVVIYAWLPKAIDPTTFWHGANKLIGLWGS